MHAGCFSPPLCFSISLSLIYIFIHSHHTIHYHYLGPHIYHPLPPILYWTSRSIEEPPFHTSESINRALDLKTLQSKSSTTDNNIPIFDAATATPFLSSLELPHRPCHSCLTPPASLSSFLVPKTTTAPGWLFHYYDDSSTYSKVVLDDETEYSDLSYTPLIKSSVEFSHFSGYHYLKLEEIIVGDKHIKLPDEKLLPGKNGNGGTIIDTGIPSTFLERSIFQEVCQEFENQMANITRAPDQGVLGPCFSTVDTNIQSLPRLTFVFDGGVKMEFPVQNYFLVDDKAGVLCLSLTTDTIGGEGPNVGLSGGPIAILGNYLLMDFFLEFNLQNSTFGFRQEYCD